jgi:hypothetical protein
LTPKSYKLDDKLMDADFLSAKTILCMAAIQESKRSTIQEGDGIVVILSNGKKYRGTLGKFHFAMRNGIASGKLEIQKSKK